MVSRQNNLLGDISRRQSSILSWVSLNKTLHTFLWLCRFKDKFSLETVCAVFIMSGVDFIQVMRCILKETFNFGLHKWTDHVDRFVFSKLYAYFRISSKKKSCLSSDERGLFMICFLSLPSSITVYQFLFSLSNFCSFLFKHSYKCMGERQAVKIDQS